MVDDKMTVNTEMLNSWKEVAIYLGRGVRTVQRWEIDLGLPVRRPRGKPRSAVIAFKAELDSWLTGSQKDTPQEEATKKPLKAPPRTQVLHSNTELLMSKTRQLLDRSVDLCTQSQSLCERLNRGLATTVVLATKGLRPPPFTNHLNPKTSTTNS